MQYRRRNCGSTVEWLLPRSIIWETESRPQEDVTPMCASPSTAVDRSPPPSSTTKRTLCSTLFPCSPLMRRWKWQRANTGRLLDPFNGSPWTPPGSIWQSTVLKRWGGCPSWPEASTIAFRSSGVDVEKPTRSCCLVMGAATSGRERLRVRINSVGWAAACVQWALDSRTRGHFLELPAGTRTWYSRRTVSWTFWNCRASLSGWLCRFAECDIRWDFLALIMIAPPLTLWIVVNTRKWCLGELATFTGRCNIYKYSDELHTIYPLWLHHGRLSAECCKWTEDEDEWQLEVLMVRSC